MKQTILELCSDISITKDEARSLLNIYEESCECPEWEEFFTDAIDYRNMIMLEALYEFCPNPNYSYEDLKIAILGLKHLNNSCHVCRKSELLTREEEMLVYRERQQNEHMLRYILKHQGAVDTLKGDFLGEGPMMNMIVFDLYEGEISHWELEHLFRIVLILAAYRCFSNDFGPNIMGEFELNKLDDYSVVSEKENYLGKWLFLNEKGDIVAEWGT